MTIIAAGGGQRPEPVVIVTQKIYNPIGVE
jgi:hypothetical protein